VTRALTALAFALVVVSVSSVVQPSQGRDLRRRPMLNNATAQVMLLHLEPGAGVATHTDPFPLLLVQLTPGDVDLTVSGARARGPRGAGLVTFVPADTPHVLVNAGATPFEMIAIALKPTRPAAPAAPPTEAPAGITRTILIDNNDVRVVRVQFAPGSREPVHTHPNDLLTVQLTPGTFDVLMGSARVTGRRAVGFTQFLPRDVSHAYVSTDSEPFELLSISIK
jgi:quercetin dioxygenase-like cupin family protein